MIQHVSCACAMQALTIIESFMLKHFTSNFKELAVEFAKLELTAGKAGKRISEAAVGEAIAGDAKPKRVRQDLTRLGRQYIAAYLEQYIEFSGSAVKRAALFAAILEAAQVHQPRLSPALGPPPHSSHQPWALFCAALTSLGPSSPLVALTSPGPSSARLSPALGPPLLSWRRLTRRPWTRRTGPPRSWRTASTTRCRRGTRR